MTHIGVGGAGRYKPNIGYLIRNPNAIGSGVSVGGDIEQTGDGVAQAYVRSGSGFSPGGGLDQSSNAHALWNLYTPNVDMSCQIGVADGSGIYFRYKNINNMWRVVVGEYLSNTFTQPDQYVEAQCTGCYLTSYSVTQSEFSYECTSLYSSGTVYGNNYSYCSYGGYSELYNYSRVWKTFCSSSCGCNPTFANEFGCNAKCQDKITRTYYQCTGGSAGSMTPGYTIYTYSPRVHIEYRNGSSTWTNFATINESYSNIAPGGLRVRAVGNSIIVYRGTYGQTSGWTQIGSYSSSLHNDGTFHGIGIAGGKNANSRGVSSGVQGFTLEGI